MKILAVVTLLIGLIASSHGLADEVKEATVYKSPQCGCCDEYVDYLRQHDFKVAVVTTPDLSLIKREHGVPAALGGCHTTIIDGYVVEGHVPVNTINRLLTEKPDIKGISLPGMPQGSPGMGGPKTEPFTIYEVSTGEPSVYAVE